MGSHLEIWAVLHVIVLVFIMSPFSMTLYIWSVLSFSQTHGLSVLYVVYFTTCLVCHWQKWGGAIVAFHKFKYSTSPSESIGQ